MMDILQNILYPYACEMLDVLQNIFCLSACEKKLYQIQLSLLKMNEL